MEIGRTHAVGGGPYHQRKMGDLDSDNPNENVYHFLTIRRRAEASMRGACIEGTSSSSTTVNPTKPVGLESMWRRAKFQKSASRSTRTWSRIGARWKFSAENGNGSLHFPHPNHDGQLGKHIVDWDILL